MDYIQNTEADIASMVKAIGVARPEDLFESIPEPLRFRGSLGLPPPLSEPELLAHLGERAERNARADRHACFLGAGWYRRFVPAVVEQLAARSEFYTAYTPYQAEASQGLLQAFFEFQTMVCSLYGMDAANASHYDAATALAEALLMACTITGRSEVVVSAALHPEYRRVAATYLREAGISIREVPVPGGVTGREEASRLLSGASACLAFQVPNFFGGIEPARALVETAHQQGALAVAVADPVSLGLLHAPGRYGADIAVGEGQSLGLDLNFGGPGVGLLSTRRDYVKRLPGRIIGATVDVEGRRAYVLTLQTREQHIRREKASSNICSNQALMALRATLYLAAVGPRGLRRVAELGTQKAHALQERVCALPGYRRAHDVPFLNEFVVRCPRDPEAINRALLERQILGGLPLKTVSPDLADAWLLCATETTTAGEIDRLTEALKALG
jgi:glycine dehydrogenase subunit 1